MSITTESSIKRNTALNLLGNAFPLIIAVIAIPIALRSIGDSRFAILTLVWIIVGSTSLFDLGMSRTTTKFVSKAISSNEDSLIPSIICAAVYIQMGIGVFFSLIIFLMAPAITINVLNIPPEFIAETISAFRVVGLMLPFLMLSSSLRGVLEASNRFGLVNLNRSIFSCFTYICPVIGGSFGWGLGQITLLFFLSRFIQMILYYFACNRIYPRFTFLCGTDAARCKSMLGYGGWIAFSNILSPIQENTERLLLAGLLPINLLTYYSVPKEITDRISIIPGSLISALFPVISSIDISEREKLVQVFNQSFKAICFSVGLILVLLVCLSEVALTVWINEEFSLRSSAVLKIFSFGVLASSLSGLTMIVFQGLGRPDITAKQQLIRFPIILAMAWFMITEYGLVGAAGAWTLGRSLALFMNMIALKVLLNISYLKIIQVESIISLAVFPLAYSFYYSTINLLGTNSIALNFMLLVICLLIFLGIHWMCVFSRDDRVWVSRLLNLKN